MFGWAGGVRVRLRTGEWQGGNGPCLSNLSTAGTRYEPLATFLDGIATKDKPDAGQDDLQPCMERDHADRVFSQSPSLRLEESEASRWLLAQGGGCHTQICP